MAVVFAVGWRVFVVSETRARACLFIDLYVFFAVVDVVCLLALGLVCLLARRPTSCKFCEVCKRVTMVVWPGGFMLALAFAAWCVGLTGPIFCR